MNANINRSKRLILSQEFYASVKEGSGNLFFGHACAYADLQTDPCDLKVVILNLPCAVTSLQVTESCKSASCKPRVHGQTCSLQCQVASFPSFTY